MLKESPKVRLSLDVSVELNHKLESLALQLGGTKSDAMRKAISLMEIALQGKQNNQTLQLANRNGEKHRTIIVI